MLYKVVDPGYSKVSKTAADKGTETQKGEVMSERLQSDVQGTDKQIGRLSALWEVPWLSTECTTGRTGGREADLGWVPQEQSLRWASCASERERNGRRRGQGRS